jgi:hypothetical protein
MKPSIGRIVHLIGPYANSNGAGVAPAIITRVWANDMVNVTAFPDAGGAQPVTSVRLYADEESARAASATHEYPQSSAFWPARA